MKLNAGMRLKSVVCSTEVVIIKAPATGEVIGCGGQPMVALADVAPDVQSLEEAQPGQALIGKRYVDEETELEALCSKQGFGALTFEGRELILKQPKPLPSSD